MARVYVPGREGRVVLVCEGEDHAHEMEGASSNARSHCSRHSTTSDKCNQPGREIDADFHVRREEAPVRSGARCRFREFGASGRRWKTANSNLARTPGDSEYAAQRGLIPSISPLAARPSSAQARIVSSSLQRIDATESSNRFWQ